MFKFVPDTRVPGFNFVPDTGVPGFRVGLPQGGVPTPAGNANVSTVDDYPFGDPRGVGTNPASLFQPSSLPARPTQLENLPGLTRDRM